MADQVGNGFLESLPIIGNLFAPKTEVIDTPINSTPIPDEGSLDTTQMVVLPDAGETPKPAENTAQTTPATTTPPAPTSTITPAKP